MSNPFSLETDNKKFFTSLSGGSLDDIYDSDVAKQYMNRIKKMNQQLQQMARQKQQKQFKQSQLDYILKRQKPTIGLGDFVTALPNKNDKKFRVRALLKEKKESLHDFLNKKKEIYLSKMNINIKKEETSKLADSIRDEQQTLKARQLYFDLDVSCMHNFIRDIKKDAEQACKLVQQEQKKLQKTVSQLNSIQAQIQKNDNLISKQLQILESLQKFKQFIETLYDQKGNPNWIKYVKKVNQQVYFMTEGGANLSTKNLKDSDGDLNFVIKYQPKNMIQIFNNSEQANIRQIQKLQDKQDELQSAVFQEKQQQYQLSIIVKQNQQRISILQRNYSRKLEQCQRMKQLKKANNNKINILDNQNLDIDKVRNKIYGIYQQVNSKRAQEIEQIKNQGEIKRQMAQIQGDIQKMRLLIKQLNDQHSSLTPEVEKQIKNKQKQQNVAKKHDENKRLEIKKQQEQEKKRSQAQNQKPRGRKDMQKVVLIKKQKIEKPKTNDDQNQDEQYFQHQN